MKKIFTLIAIVLFGSSAFAQVLMSDDFNYSGNDSLASNGWVILSGATTNAMRANVSGLTYAGYPGSGNGNGTYLLSSGQDAAKDPTTVPTSGNVYTSFLARIDTPRTGDYFFALLPTGNTGTSYTGRTFIKAASTGYFRVAISKGSETAVYSSDSFAVGTTYLFVIKYIFNTANSTDDSLALYVLQGAIPSNEPAKANGFPVSPTAADLANIGRVAFRQGSAASSASLAIDGLRFGTTWSDVVVGIKPPPPAALNLVVTGTGQTSLNINWGKPLPGYVDSAMTTLVFVKKSSVINVGTPTKGPGAYTANTNFSLNGTQYQNDSLAKCVMNSDSSSVNVTGLTLGTTYFVTVFVVRNADSSYATAVGGSGATNGTVPPPNAVKAFTATSPTPYAGNVGWNKDTSYNNSTMTTLVFMKKGTIINIGTPTKNASVYTANSNFPNATSGYENDSFAKCIYKGDSAKFTVTGLSPNSFYTLVSYVVRDADSSYSSPAVTTDTTFTFKPNPVTVLKFSTLGLTSATLSWTKAAGYIDSNMTTLAFVKQGTAAITTGGNLSKDASTYSANPNFSGNGTAFQLDSLAKCVYNGDSGNVQLTGLLSNTNYWAVVYTVRKADSSYYSAAVVTSAVTTANPNPVTAFSFTPSSQTTATINWTKPAGYTTLDNQIVVFVKPLSNINTLKPIKPTGYYNANANFSVGGTAFENDSLAKCVYNGDSNVVSLTGLTLGTTYYAVAYVGRIPDSSYSSGAISSGITFGSTLPPLPLVSTSSNNTGANSGVVSWVRDSGYVDSALTTIVFAKKGSAVTQGIPTKGLNAYTANLDFTGNGTAYQNDSLAKCIYKGDGTKVAVVGLDPSTTYYFLEFVVRDKDSSYSTSKVTSFTTQAPLPSPVTAVTVGGVSLSSAKIAWTKPAGYNNTTMSTLVFVKETNLINTGAPTKNPSVYLASSVFGAGTTYQGDSAAYSVYKGDTNFVVVTNMKRGVNYKVLIYSVRDADSMYSAGATSDGYALAPPPVSPIGVIAHVNPTTGVPDSLNVKVRVRGVAYGYNQRPAGLQFVLRDGSGGITLFRATGNFGYNNSPPEGDSIEAEGSVSTFRGLAEINLDTIVLLGFGKTLKNPTKVNIVEEAGENDLLRIDSVKFLSVPTGGIWPAASSNISLTNPHGDTIVVRVLSNCNLAGSPLPKTAVFSVVGLGVQFSTSAAAPFAFNGYQLFPRSFEDVISMPVPDTLLRFNLLNPGPNANINISPDTSIKIIFRWMSSKSTALGINAQYTILLDTIGGNFSNPKIAYPSGNAGADTSLSVRSVDIGAFLSLAPGNSFTGIWTVVANGATYKRMADSVFRITFTMPIPPQDTLRRFHLLTPGNNAVDTLQGTSGSMLAFNWTAAKSTVPSITPIYTFVFDTIGGNFSNPKLMFSSGSGGLDTVLNLNMMAIADALSLTTGQTYSGQWSVGAVGGSYLRVADSVHFITFTRGLFTGVKELGAQLHISVYPNPSSETIHIDGERNKTLDEAVLIDITGRRIGLSLTGQPGTYQADVAFCMPGIYLLQMKYGTTIVNHKIQINK